MKCTSIKSAKGFTLIELLVVISIILIASSVIFIGGNGGDSAKLSSSQGIAAGIVKGARGQAILKGGPSLLIINNDDTDIEKYRRFFGIVYYQADDPSTRTDESGWVAGTQGTYLPDGIYFDPELSKDFGNYRTAEPGTSVVLDYPSIQPQKITPTTGIAPGEDTYLFYRFNSNGTSANPNEWLALRAGNYDATGTLVDYESDGEKSLLKVALIIRRAGTTTLVDDPTKVISN